MPDERTGTLTIESHGGWPVRDVVDFLDTLKTSYDGLLLIEILTEALVHVENSRRSWLREYGPWPVLPVAELPGRLLSLLALPDSRLAGLIREEDQLVVSRVSLSSPGTWDFIGKLNPLETIREYLKDRHARRQDREYREGAERERLHLENQLLQNQVIQGRVEILQGLGLPDAEITAAIGRFVSEPLQGLGTLQDRGMILPPASDANQERTET
jgi:hypothetical protein